MESSVNINKLRKGIRYTFIDKNGNQFRAIFDEYQSLNGIKNTAMCLSNVTNLQGNIYLQGHLHIPLHFINKVSIYTLPNKTLSYFQYLLPEVNLIVNQYI
jgi:hypothetical protein